MVAGQSTAIIKSEAKKLKMRFVISVHTVFNKCLVRAACVSAEKERHSIKTNLLGRIMRSVKNSIKHTCKKLHPLFKQSNIIVEV